jgi:hypothetical protein
MLVLPERMAAVAPDPDDLAVVEAAHAVPDRTIVTGNLAHYPDEVLRGARPLIPSQALSVIGR